MLQQRRLGKTLASYDYGERKLGTVIGYQQNRKSPIRTLFAENINLFPKKLPTVEYLMRKFNMWPNDGVMDANKLLEEDAHLKMQYKTVWPAEFEKQEADLIARKKQLTKLRKTMQTMIEKGTTAVTDEAFIATKKSIAELEADKTIHEDGKMAKTRWHQFVLRRVFSSEDVDDEEEDDEIPANLAKRTCRENAVLAVYFEFWTLCIGRIDFIRMEEQVLAIGAKGALGQASMGALMLNLANWGERTRPDLDYPDPKSKLRVFPFQPLEIQSLARGGKLSNRNWWMSIGASANLRIQIQAMTPTERKRLLPNFPDLEGYIEEKNKTKEAKRIAAALAATAQPSSEPIVVAAAIEKNPKKRKREEAAPINVGLTEEDDDDILAQPAFVAAWSSGNVIDLNSDSDSDGEGFKSITSVSKPKSIKSKGNTKEKTPSGKPKTNSKAKATKPKKKAVPMDEDDEMMPAKKKKKHANFGNQNRATSYAYFSIGDKKTAEKRIFNKKEAVRRVGLLCEEHHDRDIEGEKWKLRYKHKWNDDDKRDVADAFLQMVYCFHEVWEQEG